VNDTRVIKARLHGRKDSGGEVEVLVERVLDAHRALAQVRAEQVAEGGAQARSRRRRRGRGDGSRGRILRAALRGDAVLDVLARHGEVPLPPYITHAADGGDESRYQTVYARAPGAVAAPTAGLHFDDALLRSLAARGRGDGLGHAARGRGHVPAGACRRPLEHVMHSEWYSIPQATVDAIASAREKKGRVVAVGTTALRALESAAAGREEGPAAGSAETSLFIVPGFRFRVVDRLVTNFHLPRSTLLMLVSAFAGVDNIRRAYAHAVAERYRFFSYGDAMFLSR
jgi:S-adenosylmethionine:tRNA ribosyltransferase-isomerase